LTREAFENAITVDMAVGGSTNAVVHLLAIAGRTPVKLVLDDFDTISRRTPFLVNVRPSGKHMMEDFFFAGGVPAVMRELLPLLHGACLTVNGKTIDANVREAPCYNREVILAYDQPLFAEGGLVLAATSAPMEPSSNRRRRRRTFASTPDPPMCSRAISRCTIPSTAWTCRSIRTRSW
jgi:dihydroxy-acid dehydratase